jgi:hypothetical protein
MVHRMLLLELGVAVDRVVPFKEVVAWVLQSLLAQGGFVLSQLSGGQLGTECAGNRPNCAVQKHMSRHNEVWCCCPATCVMPSLGSQPLCRVFLSSVVLTKPESAGECCEWHVDNVKACQAIDGTLL